MDTAAIATIIVAVIGALASLWVGLRRLRQDERDQQDEQALELQKLAFEAAQQAIRQYREELDIQRHHARKQDQYIVLLRKKLLEAGLDIPPYPDTGELTQPRKE